MIFCLYTDYGALNSKPIFEAFAKSLIDAGHTVIYNEPYRVMDHYATMTLLLYGAFFGMEEWQRTKLYGNRIVC